MGSKKQGESAPAPVRVKGLEFAHEPGSPVFRGADARARGGEITVLVGPEGAGKSTLLRLVAGELVPAGGTVVAPSPVARFATVDAEAYALDDPDTGFEPAERRELWTRLEDRATAGAAVLVTSRDFAAMERHAHAVWIIDEGLIREAGPPQQAVDRHGRPLIATAAPSPAASARLRLAALKLGLEPLGGPRDRWLFDVESPDVASLVPTLAEACPESSPTLIPAGLEAVALRVGARSHGRRSRR